jgi:aspartate racemase
MLDSARKLAAAGAELLICPDNTIHVAMDYVRERSPLPWLHIAEVVAAEARRRGLWRLGIMGTRWLVASEVYPSKLEPSGIAAVRTNPADSEEVNRIIMDELVLDRQENASVAYLQSVVRRLQIEGCDGLVLGCTELPLVLGDHNCPIPALDSTRLLARAAREYVSPSV